jgi:hypothetical protein
VEVRNGGERGQAELRVQRAVAVRSGGGLRRGIEGDIGRGGRGGGQCEGEEDEEMPSFLV